MNAAALASPLPPDEEETGRSRSTHWCRLVYSAAQKIHVTGDTALLHKALYACHARNGINPRSGSPVNDDGDGKRNQDKTVLQPL